MKNIILSFIFLIVVLTIATVSQAQQWYEGGTLHDAGLHEWLQADERNRLATCADFLLGTPEGRQIFEKQGAEYLKPLAQKLLRNIDDALNSGKFNMGVREAGIMGLAIMKLQQYSK